MGIVLLLLLFVAGLLISNLSAIAFGNNRIGYFLSFVVAFILSALVTYTPDWVGYESWIEEDIGRDIFFRFFVNNLLPQGWGYQFVHIFFVSSYTILLIYIISRFTDQTYLVLLLYLGIVYLFYSTQIRFFMGYFSISLAFYLWFVEGKRRASIFFLLFAVLNHGSLLFFLPFVYFFMIDVETLIRRIFMLLMLIVVIYFISTLFLTEDSENVLFLTYLASEEHESTLLGGLFSFLPSLISFFLIHLYVREKISEFPFLLDDKKFQYLYRFMIISVTFIGISLERQVIGQRFIIPSAIFQILLLFYIGGFNERRQNMTLVSVAGAYYAMYLFYHYGLSMMITSSNVTNMVIEMLRSNYVIQFFLK